MGLITFFSSHGTAIVGSAALLASLSTATCIGHRTASDPFDIETEAVWAKRDGVSADIQIDFTLTPHARARFMSIEGDLFVHDKITRYRIEGLEKGDVLYADHPREVSVTVDADMLDMAITMVQTIFRGDIEVVFEGEAKVKVLGFPVRVPVEVERKVGFQLN